MTLRDYKKMQMEALRQASLCFLLRSDEVLLALKKRGFGEGKLTGIGGRQEVGESIEETAVRETVEEIGVIPQQLRRMATLNFYFPHKPKEKGWDQKVCVFVTDSWQGEPSESEEMVPQWVKTADIPFGAMWADARYWLPMMLTGKVFTASFIFDEALEIEDFEVIEGLC